MNSKSTLALLILGTLALTSQAVWADRDRHNDRHNGRDKGRYTDTDYARVLDVDPIVRRVRVSEPRRECYQETRYETDRYYEDRDRGRYASERPAAGSMILGGIIGAAVGNQIGSGDGRRAATVAGALIGSAIGHDTAGRRTNRGERAYTVERPYTVERCDVRYDERWEERIEGYRVTYEYNGRQFTTRLPYDPGPRLRVQVNVRPDEG